MQEVICSLAARASKAQGCSARDAKFAKYAKQQIIINWQSGAACVCAGQKLFAIINSVLNLVHLITILS